MRTPTEISVEAARAIFESRGGIMRTGEAIEAGIHWRTLYWMRDQGLLEQMSRGVYLLSTSQSPESYDVAIVMRRVPRAVLCLVSALSYHGIGTQVPHSVQIALPKNIRPPRIDYPPTRVFVMDDAALAAGVEERTMGGLNFKVFSVAKTVADCFKYRNKIGLDVAVEALQEVVQERKATPAEIMQYARILRVESVVAPYIQALL